MLSSFARSKITADFRSGSVHPFIRAKAEQMKALVDGVESAILANNDTYSDKASDEPRRVHLVQSGGLENFRGPRGSGESGAHPWARALAPAWQQAMVGTSALAAVAMIYTEIEANVTHGGRLDSFKAETCPTPGMATLGGAAALVFNRAGLSMETAEDGSKVYRMYTGGGMLSSEQLVVEKNGTLREYHSL